MNLKNQSLGGLQRDFEDLSSSSATIFRRFSEFERAKYLLLKDQERNEGSATVLTERDIALNNMIQKDNHATYKDFEVLETTGLGNRKDLHQQNYRISMKLLHLYFFPKIKISYFEEPQEGHSNIRKLNRKHRIIFRMRFSQENGQEFFFLIFAKCPRDKKIAATKCNSYKLLVLEEEAAHLVAISTFSFLVLWKLFIL
jgi:hypothetical protein